MSLFKLSYCTQDNCWYCGCSDTPPWAIEEVAFITGEPNEYWLIEFPMYGGPELGREKFSSFQEAMLGAEKIT